MYGISSALTTKPARSCESIVRLAERALGELVRAVDASRSEVMIERTTSTSGSTGTGLKKCRPSTRSGCAVSAPSFMIGTDEVFEARNSASGSMLVERAEQLALGCSSSTIASIAASAPSRSSSVGGDGEALGGGVALAPRRACRSARARSSDCSIAARVRSARSSSTSTTVTSTPERAQTSAIPEPMRPPPITPTRMGRDASWRLRGRRARAASAATGRRPARRRRSSAASSSRAGPSRPAPRSAAACRATSAASSIVELLRDRRLVPCASM